MKATWYIRYLLSIVPACIVINGNLLGGYWALGGALFIAVLLLIIDLLLKEDRSPIPQTLQLVPDLILGAHVFFQSACVFSLLYGVQSGILEGRVMWWAIASTGVNSGFEGIISAHEMIHRKQLFWQKFGIWNLLTVNYAHFFVEHIRNHHRHVGTPRDPATARYGETVYGFFLRTVPQQFISAIHLEATRLRRNNRSPFGLRNFVVRVTLSEAAICITLYFAWSKWVMMAFVIQSLIAIFLLEYVNYIEHYGLVREEGKKVNPTHSWQSDLPVSRFALIELSRHPDHHLTASKPFYKLESYEESPVMPLGYFGSFYTALIPPLWFRIVNPVLKQYLAQQSILRETPE
jgi:alkane 1-monooxygenase